MPYCGLGGTLRDRHDYLGASRAHREAIRLRPQEVDTQLALGVSLMMAGRLPEADVALAAARPQPKAVLARQLLAELCEKEYANPREALRICREIRAVAPATAGVADCVTRNQRRVSDSERGTNGR